MINGMQQSKLQYHCSKKNYLNGFNKHTLLS